MNCSCFDPAVPSYCDDNFRIGLDRFCDFIPIVSTVTNLIELFQKCAYSAAEKPEGGQQDSYWSYIGNKDNLRCILLAIPFFNMPVAIYYYFFSPVEDTSSKENVFENSEANGLSSINIALEESSLVPSEQNVTLPLDQDESSFIIFPREIVFLIFSFARRVDPHSLSNAFKVSRLWSLSVNDVVTQTFREEAFGNAQWKAVGAGDLVKDEDMDEEAASLSAFIDDITKDIFKALYMLRVGRIVRMPEKLDLENTGALVALKLPKVNKNGYRYFYPPDKQEHAGGSYWFWGTKTPIKDTRGKSYSIQQTKSAEHGCQDSHAREIAARCFAEYCCTGTSLCKCVWPRCLDKRGESQVVVGFGRAGLVVSNCSYDDDSVAVLGVLRWRPAEVRSSVLG